MELAARTAVELVERGRVAARLKEVTRPSVVGQLNGRWVVGWPVGWCRLVGGVLVGWLVGCQSVGWWSAWLEGPLAREGIPCVGGSRHVS